MTPADMRKEADRLDAEIDRLRARADQLRQTADVVERLSGMEPLTSGPQSATNSPMGASAIASQVEPASRTPGRDITSDGPVAVVAKRLGLSIKDLSAKVGAKYETARKWNTRGTVPDDIREAFDRLLASAPAKRPGKSSR